MYVSEKDPENKFWRFIPAKSLDTEIVEDVAELKTFKSSRFERY